MKLFILLALAVTSLAAQESARFVRISLPGEGRTLALAEVEILSRGKNVAPFGTASQSSVAYGGVPERAMDGKKSPHFNQGGMTHNKDLESNPWWEIDLGQMVPIDEIGIWNRGAGFGDRLSGFSLEFYDEKRQLTFASYGLEAPSSSLHLDLKNGGRVYHADRQGRRKAIKHVPSDYRDPLPFRFQKNDRVAILGNGLADRMQHHAWTESTLQTLLVGEKVTFRNLSMTGDQFNRFKRSSGFTPMVDFIRRIDATVIFGFFGYNESFKLSAEQYEKGLTSFVRNARSWGKGDRFPRIVLFSPIPHEDFGVPWLPDGKENNKRLEAFTAATRRAADQAGVQFVDLYQPFKKLYASAKTPLTINGIHLNEEGYRHLAQIIAQALTGQAPGKIPGRLHEAVKEKNKVWHSRYRAVDGNDIWGSRSGIKYANKQTNADVLENELHQLDVMTATRDRHVHAVAARKKSRIDDSNLPAPVKVQTNIKYSLAPATDKSAKYRYLTAAESLKKFTVKDGFQAQIFADESRFPQLVNPVQMQVDARGRLWVAVWPTYPMVKPGEEMNDAILIFEDNDGDGRADSVKEFAKAHCPIGFEFWNGGVIVASQPDLLFFRDTDGDDIADEKTILLQGLGSSDTHHSANNLIMGPDGAIYWQSGIFLVNSFESPYGPAVQTGTSGMYRFDPRSFEISLMAGIGSNPHGIAFDQWGYQYATDGTSGRAYQVRVQGNRFRMKKLLEKEVRPVPACEIISSQHFPEDLQQDFFICNTITYLGIKHYDLHRNGYREADYQAGQVWGTPASDFLHSRDANFRPSDTIIGADGSLFVADWHNALIGHMQHNVRDPQRDQTHGRIFRVTAKGRDLEQPAKIAGASISELLELLKHPTNSVRHRVRVELTSRPLNEVRKTLEKWLTGQSEEQHLMEGLWVSQIVQQPDFNLLARLRKSEDVHIRHAAERVKVLLDQKAVTQEIEDEGSHEIQVKKGGIEFDRPDLTGVRINTLVEKLQYDVKEFKVKAGKAIQLTFVNPDFMPHNIVFVKPGQTDSVAAAAIALGADGFKKEFLPETEDILVASKLLDHKGEQVLKFKAPAKPGTYPFVCTFPGHATLMRGVMEVEK